MRALWFNLAKRPHLKKYQAAQTAVRLHNVRSTMKDGIASTIIQNITTIDPVTMPFPYEHAEVSSSLPSLATLQEVSIEQLKQIQSKVSNITGIRQLESCYGQTLHTQEVHVIVVDHTTSI